MQISKQTRTRAVEYGEPEDVVREYAAIAHSLNALVELRTGTAPMLAGADFCRPAMLDLDWTALGRRIDRLSDRVSTLAAERAAYLRDCLAAFALMVREGKNEQVPYRERVATYLQVPAELVDPDTVAALTQRLQDLLQVAGYGADVSAALALWFEVRALGSTFLPTARTWTDAARARTRRVVFDVPEHSVTITLLDNYPHYAYSEYLGNGSGEIRFSNDIPWTGPALKHSICHEAFPGHQAFWITRQRLLDDHLLPPEAAIYFANTPVTPINEGWAECGTEVLRWIESADDEIFATYNSLCFAVSTNIAFECNENGLSKMEAIERLIDVLHVEPSWAEQRYAFITHPLWCTSFPHYWYGRKLMMEAYQSMKRSLDVFARMVYEELHTVRTLRGAIERYLVSAPGTGSDASTNVGGKR